MFLSKIQQFPAPQWLLKQTAVFLNSERQWNQQKGVCVSCSWVHKWRNLGASHSVSDHGFSDSRGCEVPASQCLTRGSVLAVSLLESSRFQQIPWRWDLPELFRVHLSPLKGSLGLTANTSLHQTLPPPSSITTVPSQSQHDLRRPSCGPGVGE